MAYHKKNKVGYSFVAFPRRILNSTEYTTLTSKAVKLLLDIFAQYNGTNNGDFSVAWSVMKKRGWKSRDTLYNALRELENKGFIEKTRQGGKHRCSLYCVSWLPINECCGKLDIKSSRVPSNAWKINT